MNEVVTCPGCSKEVKGEVMRFAFMAILAKCPECGAGPIALIAQMMNELGDGAISVTLESEDTIALTALLSDCDPRFDTVVEASDYLRGRFEGDRVSIRVTRAVAGMLAAAARTYSNVHVISEEELVDAGQPMPIFNAANGDAVMDDAIARARASVHRFIARMSAPEPGDEGFGVKARIVEGDRSEHMWLNEVRLSGGEFVGVLDATPRYVRSVQRGQEVRVKTSEISDWAFGNGDSMYGNYTIRVMLPSLPKRMQLALEGRLVPLD
jgi:uncharacterized protein YegJ (DUF2314 family)